MGRWWPGIFCSSLVSFPGWYLGAFIPVLGTMFSFEVLAAIPRQQEESCSTSREQLHSFIQLSVTQHLLLNKHLLLSGQVPVTRGGKEVGTERAWKDIRGVGSGAGRRRGGTQCPRRGSRTSKAWQRTGSLRCLKWRKHL